MRDLNLEKRENLDPAFRNRNKYSTDRPRLTLELIDAELEKFGLEVVIAWENDGQIVFKIDEKNSFISSGKQLSPIKKKPFIMEGMVVSCWCFDNEKIIMCFFTPPLSEDDYNIVEKRHNMKGKYQISISKDHKEIFRLMCETLLSECE